MLTGRYLPFGYPFSLKKRTPPPFPHISSGEACVHTWGLKGRGRSSGKTTFSFGSSFSLKKECVHLYTRSTPWEICAYMGMEKEMKRLRKSGYSPFILLFPLQKDMCIFIHISSYGVYVHTWGEKRRDRIGEKANNCTLPWSSFFGSSLSLAIKHVHTYSHTKRGRRPLCILIRTRNGSKTPKKKGTTHLRSHFPLALLFPLQYKMCIFMHTKTHQAGRRMCAYMADGKRGEEGAKRRMFFPHTKRGRRPCEKGKELRRYPLFALLFAFLCFAFLCSFLSFFWI